MLIDDGRPADAKGLYLEFVISVETVESWPVVRSDDIKKEGSLGPSGIDHYPSPGFSHCYRLRAVVQ